jgi:nicotinamide-nucleotide amidase
MRRGEIIAIGSELLEGRFETNSLFLAEELGALGVEVRFKSVVGDDKGDIIAALLIASRRAEVVVLTGGLGPTVDDCTRQAVARATGKRLHRSSEAVEGMVRRLAAWGRTPTHAQFRQGMIPAGAEVLANPVGSAPGFCLKWRGCLIAALPGVPVEAEQMFATALSHKILTHGPARAARERIERRLLHTFGLTESDLDQRLKDLKIAKNDLRLGLRASPLGVTVALTACGARSAPAVSAGKGGGRSYRRLDSAVQRAKKEIGRYVYAEGHDTMEAIVGRLLTARGLTLAVAESCTGGLIGHRLTQIPGSSAYLDRVAVCYSNRAKIEWLAVPPSLIRRVGAVSAEVAAAMAGGVRRRSRTSIGLSVTGIAGPDGGTPQKPVGLVYVGLNAKKGRQSGEASLTREFRFHGTRDMIKLRASQAALDLLRQWLAETGRSKRS